MKIKHNVWDVVIRIILLFWAILIILPLFWFLYESLKTNQEFFMNIWALPSKLQFNNYAKAWKSAGIMMYMGNTVFILAVTLLLSTALAGMASYILARFKFKLNRIIFWMITLSMMLPGINAITTQFILMKQLKLTDSLWGLCIYLTASAIPFSIFILTGFMKTIPHEMEESAYMDGCSYSRTFFSILLPMCKPGIVAINIFNFLGVYNSYLAPLLFISDEKKYPIAVGISNLYIKMMYQADWVTLFAGSVITMVPVILFYTLFQKQLISGTTIGAIKG
ncbi:carbohydrate ABC transporter permease [Paenibacillus eucommiae]|uniref:Raffinose/stachyose/melibiose transport system permease protein/N-acetylglucosamine transport system permease protein n=1 Tax=Paenibacillus eucommiae TaxID=1355755 RepID=A0ABS4IP21_9BACL|nr:carbohydrate ABC transporter permease [Paenibacillus eucommiae]MBP1988676.1 raffinose/stachyose/melibiose transport system permease protein/N-acetylglucosamine transport system permease protein [Paenibacillus eucommiae]